MEIQARNDAGSLVTLKSDDYNQFIVLASGGRLQRACEEGRLFVAANQAAVATTAGLNGTWTGLSVVNPTGSGKNLIFHEFGWALSAAGSAAAAIGIATTDTTGLVSVIVPRNRKFGGAASVAISDDGGSITAPVLEQVFGSIGTGNVNLVNGTGSFAVDLKGGLILVPGRAVVTYTSAATTAALIFHFLWEEIDAA